MTRRIVLMLQIALAAAAVFPVYGGAPQEETGVARLRHEAAKLEPLVASRLARNFLKATAALPAVAPRTIYRDGAGKTYLTEAAAGSRATKARQPLEPVPVDETFYYTTKYGSPLAYARPIEILGQSGVDDVAGWKILDFGYGTVGHLRLLAALGADVTGVDVDPLLPALYGAPDDQGIIRGPGGSQGRLRLIDGRFPADQAIKTAVGGKYDLIVSKNTLKRGYVHPERPVDPRRLLDLGIEDAGFVKVVYEMLKPGGRVLIYNISPAPSPADQPYKNWADGRCPFARDLWVRGGFRVAAFDRDDSDAVRALAHALGWDQGDSPIDLKTDLFALYCLLVKPAVP
jgi:hypothetical protein